MDESVDRFSSPLMEYFIQSVLTCVNHAVFQKEQL